MRVKQGTDFSFRVAIADWPVLELGLPHSKRVQFERPCQSQAQLQPLYVSEPMLLRPSGRAGGFRDVECVLPNVGSTDAVPVRRDQTLLFAIIPCLTNDLGYEDPGKTRAEAEVCSYVPRLSVLYSWFVLLFPPPPLPRHPSVDTQKSQPPKLRLRPAN
eukprot:1067254-Rhodomonas_salina.1